MSHRTTVTKSRIKVTNKSVFHLQDKKADQNELSKDLIKSAQRTGQLSLCNRGLATEFVFDESKEVDFDRSDKNSWWNREPLKTLDLSSNVIQTISPKVKFLHALVTLKLHDNALTSLPAEIGELKNLANLSLDHNKLVKLPKEFYSLTELHWLRFISQQNRLPALGELRKMTYMDANHNNIDQLPDFYGLPKNLGLLTQLQSISMEGNKLPFVRQDIIRGGTDRMMKYTLKKSQALMLPGRKLTSVPEEVLKAAALAEAHIIDISTNKLAALPMGICHVKETLSQLILSSNVIESIPPEINRCVHLQYIDLGKNCLSDLPAELGSLKKEINVSSDAFGRLKKLAVLDLANNNITSVPPELGLFTNLRFSAFWAEIFKTSSRTYPITSIYTLEAESGYSGSYRAPDIVLVVYSCGSKEHYKFSNQ
ncbi:putative mitotic protein phosphatase 1 regulator [Operophtera brumata]|uniref:Putative mitotic protein phosphatase 1 regulator n=1 Tax=Operophtera brumata TaxID=104452 RepID=A0A0L7L9D8_OPEBR|nr:putative mitotic protein phosphatase 1 regulator [Operophtera brumata]